MRVISVNVGLPRTVTWHGKSVETGIWKTPVAGRVAIVGDNLVGDRQADLSVHGGRDKAVYGYPAEHYPWWRTQLPETDLPWGAFGENLTVEGLLEDRVHIGDRFRIGSAELVVTQPRMPCFKLGIKLARPEMVKEFLRSERSGFYFAVVQAGEIGAGDAITCVDADRDGMTVTELVRLGVAKAPDPSVLRRAIELPGLAEVWRDGFRERLAGRRSE
jgi:MOSC domain-containing protein YiiM